MPYVTLYAIFPVAVYDAVVPVPSDQFANNHHGKVSEFTKENEIIGIKNKHETIGGITVDIDPLPYMKTGFYIVKDDFGDQRQCFTDDDM